ncbi:MULTISPECIES: ABC transporter permease [unclassified Nocardioides]|uniref:ABC transporter permease n=1 Tax=unclassified Nocardioides TaxID=2615069 RepID=UPI0009F0D116|nr:MULTISPECIES: ABC transporter permease [unclassified Nocardioides]GAW47953.1 Inner-membrane translocator [Nocardioides sp. PD653-B2]GAW53744.1 Inner-membrane translocator [Nocardioides sp. PD653]
MSNPATSNDARRLAWLRRQLAFRRLSAVYILIGLILIFSLVVPETFLDTGTWRSILDTQALTALAAVGLTVPTAAGVFNLAVGAEIGLTCMFVAWMLVNHGASIPTTIVLTLALGIAIGLVSSFLVTVVGIDSFIATLALSSVGAALAFAISGGTQILGMPTALSDFSTGRLAGLSYPFLVMMAVAFVIWYVLEFTPLGRRIYATGGGEEAARLAGVRTGLIMTITLVTCAVTSAIVGILLAARLGTGDPTVGPSFLLPAFSAVFLGATQFKAGRFNVWGTVVSVYVLAVGVKGLQLAGAPVWIPDLFNGLALLLAVALSKPDRLIALTRRLLARRPRLGEVQVAPGQ